MCTHKAQKIHRKAYKGNKGSGRMLSEFSAPRFLSVCGTAERCGNAGADKSAAVICDIPDISLATVKSHISHILQKLGSPRQKQLRKI